MKTDAPTNRASPRARGLGIAAGIASIACCVYPVVLVLFGLASAAEAVALGTSLFAEWGWAFKLGGAALALAGIAIQLGARGECSVGGARRNIPYIARVALLAVTVYFVLYGVTTLLAGLA